jgi:hypothetical protein
LYRSSMMCSGKVDRGYDDVYDELLAVRFVERK